MLVTILGILVFVGKNEKTEPFVGNSKKQVLKTAHISIDDATMIFKDIWWKEYESIFDNKMLGILQTMHEEYGLKVTLYVFGEMEGFAMWDFPLEYKAEFQENADWLQIGFHSGEDCDPEEDYQSQQEFELDYNRTESAIWRLAGGESVTSVLRLHNWYATEEMVTYLQEERVTALLCKDSEEASYCLAEEHVEKLYGSRDGVLEVDGITYYVTDVRLEKVENIIDILETRKKDRVIVIFTHAWCFMENSEKLEKAVQWLVEADYQFSDLKPVEEE